MYRLRREISFRQCLPQLLIKFWFVKIMPGACKEVVTLQIKRIPAIAVFCLRIKIRNHVASPRNGIAISTDA
jgi:hypothetical protein